MHIVLVAGLWLDASAWSAVEPGLRARGHVPVPVTLPGQGDGASTATLSEQVAAVVAAVDTALEESGEPVAVVGHSAAASLAWLAADARPEAVGCVAFIGGFPAAAGEAYAGFAPVVDQHAPFPGWEVFEGPDSADLDQATKDRLESNAIPVPVDVVKSEVRLEDERRYGIRSVLLCPEFTPAQARTWIEAGDSPELDRVEHLDLVDIDSGHWPMFTQPDRLADLLADAVAG